MSSSTSGRKRKVGATWYSTRRWLRRNRTSRLLSIWSMCRNGAAPNNSFKPNLLRYTKAMPEKACHGFGSTTQVGLTRAIGRRGTYAQIDTSDAWFRSVLGDCGQERRGYG